jgi:hypothetical protein
MLMNQIGIDQKYETQMRVLIEFDKDQRNEKCITTINSKVHHNNLREIKSASQQYSKTQHNNAMKDATQHSTAASSKHKIANRASSKEAAILST